MRLCLAGFKCAVGVVSPVHFLVLVPDGFGLRRFSLLLVTSDLFVVLVMSYRDEMHEHVRIEPPFEREGSTVKHRMRFVQHLARRVLSIFTSIVNIYEYCQK